MSKIFQQMLPDLLCVDFKIQFPTCQIRVPLNQSASKRKMLDKMKQSLEILIKLKLMFTNYAELFNGSITEKVMWSFWSPQKNKSAQTFPHNVYAVLCGNIFFHFITVSA